MKKLSSAPTLIMAIIDQIMVEIYHVAKDPIQNGPRNNAGPPSTTNALTVTSSAPGQVSSAISTNSSSSGDNSSNTNGSSLLWFFLAVIFSLVFVNVWYVLLSKALFRFLNLSVTLGLLSWRDVIVDSTYAVVNSKPTETATRLTLRLCLVRIGETELGY